MKELRNSVCIVGADESDELGTLPHKSQLTLHLEAARNAVRDAGLKISDVDGIFTAGQHSPATIGEALGITPMEVLANPEPAHERAKSIYDLMMLCEADITSKNK